MRYLSLFALAALLSACHQSDTNTAQNKSGVQLTESNLLNLDTALLVFRGTTGSNPASDKKFLKAIDAYRNQKKPQAALPLFRESILLQPQARAYYEMGNALLDLEKPQEALQAYSVAEAMNYKPLSKVLYNMGCAWGHLDKGDSAAYYVTSAIEFGYANTKNILNDPDLLKLSPGERGNFEWQVKATITRGTDPDKMQWAMFTHDMPQLELPLTLDMQYGHANTLADIPFDYERYVSEMRTERFSRETGQSFLAVGTVRNTDSVRTLVYATLSLFDVDDEDDYKPASPFTYYLVSYSQTGKLIDKMLIGGRDKVTDPFKVPNIQPNGDFDITLFDLIYEKNVEDSGYAHNKLKEQKELRKESYTISPDGHFVMRSNALSMR